MHHWSSSPSPNRPSISKVQGHEFGTETKKRVAELQRAGIPYSYLAEWVPICAGAALMTESRIPLLDERDSIPRWKDASKKEGKHATDREDAATPR